MLQRIQQALDADSATRERIRTHVRDLEACARSCASDLAGAHVRNANGA